jgi:hypothetical protein
MGAVALPLGSGFAVGLLTQSEIKGWCVRAALHSLVLPTDASPFSGSSSMTNAHIRKT